MPIRSVKPTSPARRYMTFVVNDDITKSTPEKSLLSPKRRSNGRNSYGRITVRHRGGGHKRMLRDIDFRREKLGIPATVKAIEYDPNRSARIALLFYRDGEKRYIIAPLGLKPGDVIMSGPQADILPGQCPAHPQYPARHAGPQRRAAAGEGRPAVSQRRHPGAGPGQGRGPRQYQAALGRGPPGQARVHGDHWTGRQPRPRERVHRQGRAGSLEGLPPDRARHGHEPRRPSRWAAARARARAITR